MELKYAILGVIMVVALLVPGYIKGEGEKFDIINKVIEAQKNVKKYTFEVKISYKKDGTTFIVHYISGKTDMENKKMYMNMSNYDGNIEIYNIGDIMYVKQAGQWFKTRSYSEMLFVNMTNNIKEIEILKDPKTKIEVISEETVNGVKCYKVKIAPDPEKSSFLYTNVLYIIYVDKATNFIQKVEVVDIKFNIEAIIIFKDINRPIDIQLPEEAKNALLLEQDI